MRDAIGFSAKEELWEFAIRRAPKSSSQQADNRPDAKGIVCMEFGVHKGRSINFFAQLDVSRAWFGFDSFEGLAEDWPGVGVLRGTFDVGGVMPTVQPNVTLVKGWFSDTLEPFLEDKDRNAGILHLDSDTYESTAYVLETLGGRIVQGSWIVFDEYFNYSGWRGTGEYRAFQEWVDRHDVSYSYRAYSEREAAVEIHEVRH